VQKKNFKSSKLETEIPFALLSQEEEKLSQVVEVETKPVASKRKPVLIPHSKDSTKGASVVSL